MRKLHFILGLVGVVGFLLSGQVMKFHQPSLASLDPGSHMMYLSRHIYLLAAALVNLILGLYQRTLPGPRRKKLQAVGSLLLVASLVLLALAFLAEPSLGMAGRSWRSFLGLICLFVGALAHLLASVGHHPARI
jgi:drug/metabolite transporter (DMT)-like permease